MKQFSGVKMILYIFIVDTKLPLHIEDKDSDIDCIHKETVQILN